MQQAGGTEGFDEQVGRIAALGEPMRRALYRYVIAQSEPVGRDHAAAALGIARHAAKFHLDRLEAAGLLDSAYSRPAGRRGPGAGRPAKRYRRSARELCVSLPERRYDLAGRILTQAIAAATASGTPVADALHEAATVEGRALGGQARTRFGPDASPAACSRAVSDVLAGHGYEPQAEAEAITLVNCPFHQLAQDQPDLICAMNLDLIRGLLTTCAKGKLRARLDPAPGRCCVTIGPRRSPTRNLKASSK